MSLPTPPQSLIWILAAVSLSGLADGLDGKLVVTAGTRVMPALYNVAVHREPAFVAIDCHMHGKTWIPNSRNPFEYIADTKDLKYICEQINVYMSYIYLYRGARGKMGQWGNFSNNFWMFHFAPSIHPDVLVRFTSLSISEEYREIGLCPTFTFCSTGPSCPALFRMHTSK